MKILMAAPEAVPYVKTGGLADVAGALCKEFRKMKHDARIVLPLYRKIRESDHSLKNTGVTVQVPVGDRLFRGDLFSDQYSNIFIGCDDFFDRQELYGTPEGDFGDNASRFIFFSRGILEACKALKFSPDIIHCNDWQTGMVPLYLRSLYKAEKMFRKTATVLTIHNIGYQGLFPASDMPLTNLGWKFFTPEGIEFYGRMNFLKAGLISADLLNTVSSTYAKEIFSREYSFGLDGILRTRESDFFGITNGLDYEEWNPSKDAFLPAVYSHDNLSGKEACKREIFRMLFRTEKPSVVEKTPLIGIVGRLSEQKGLDLVIGAMPELLSFDVKLAILGKGDEAFHKGLSLAAKKYKGRVSVNIGFSDKLAHMIYAGSDFFLMPSKYEPCGLGQLISLKYGAIPIVRKTGGLADTVGDYNPLLSRGTGFLFSDYTSSGMMESIKRAFCVFTDRAKLKKMISEGMRKDFSWKISAEKYLEMYTRARKTRKL